MKPEFSRTFALDTLGTAPRSVAIEADAGERAALARRFELVSVESLRAKADLVVRAAGIDAVGTMEARVTQACVVTDEPVQATLEVPFSLRFVDPIALAAGEEEVELHDADLDVVAHDGGAIDLGEAVAQTLGLSLDPFPRSRNAPPEGESVWRAGPDAGPFAALKGLLGE